MNNRPKYHLLSGDEAVAQGAWEAGVRVACSYPGTPATEILEYISRFKQVDSQWSVNEKVAFEVALSASISGSRSLYSSKHVGLNVAMDPLMTSAYTGVGAGFVIVTADDPGLHSSQNEQDNRLIAKFAKVPLIEPSGPAEAKELTVKAFDISEKFDTPVILRLTTRIAHTKENVAVRKRINAPKIRFKVNIGKYVMVPGNAYARHLELEKKLVRMREFSERCALNKIEPGDSKMGFITSGVSYMYVKETFPEASVLKLGMSYPFPEKLVLEFAKKVKELYVIEELEPFIEEHVRMLGIKFKAKDPSYRTGELRPEDIGDIVAGKTKTVRRSKSRTPQLCPGCPHRSVFHVLNKMKLTVVGDIGCYSLGALPPFESLHTCHSMGTGVTFLEGFKKNIKKDVVGVIGDSTFVHSGITGLINMAYNNAKGVLLILDNSTTAMTGNQPNPATGITAAGQKTKQLSLENICRSCGCDSVDVIDPGKTSDLTELISLRMRENLLSVIIARSPCKLLK